MRFQENILYRGMVSLQNYSKYFDHCWMKNDSTSSYPLLQSNDPRFVYTETESQIAGATNVLQCILGSGLNFLVLCAILRSSELRKEYLTPSIASIALTDFLYSIYPLPVLTHLYLTGDMPLPNSCSFYGCFVYLLWMVSFLNLLAISLLRCGKIYLLRSSKEKYFRRASIWAPIIAWLMSALYVLPIFFGVSGQFGLECKSFWCRFLAVNHDGKPMPVDPELYFLLLAMFAGTMMFYLNVATYYKIREKSVIILVGMNLEDAKRIIKKEHSVGRMVAMMTISACIIYLPLSLFLVIDPTHQFTQPTIALCCHVLTSMLVVIDPLVYVYTQEKYREEIKMMLKSIYLICRKTRVHN